MREDIITQLMQVQGSDDRSLYEKYSTSDLKRILEDALTVRFAADGSIGTTIVIAGIVLLLIIYVAK